MPETNDPREPVELSLVSVFSGETLRLKWTADGRPICPVCRETWPKNAEHAWTLTGETAA